LPGYELDKQRYVQPTAGVSQWLDASCPSMQTLSSTNRWLTPVVGALAEARGVSLERLTYVGHLSSLTGYPTGLEAVQRSVCILLLGIEMWNRNSRPLATPVLGLVSSAAFV